VSVPAFWRASMDSNGSRRGTLACAGAELPLASSGEFVAARFFDTSFTAGFAPGVTASFAEGLAAGVTAGFAAGFAAGVTAGVAEGFAAGFAVGVPAGRAPAAGGAGVLAGGCPCACEHVAAAVSKMALTSVITERIVRSFPLRAFQPLQAEFLLQVRELYSHQQAW